MKTMMQTQRWFVAPLAAATVMLAGLAPIASAKKPTPPPPDPPAEARYTIVDLRLSTEYAHDVNNWGQLVGTGGDRAFLVTPEHDIDDNLVWFLDEDRDGINDLMIDLGTLGGDSSIAFDVNDPGQVVGQAWTAENFTHSAFIIVPEDNFPEGEPDGVPDTWFRPDGQGGNALMISLGTPSAGGLSSVAYGISNSGYVVGVVGGSIPEERGAFIVAPEDTNGDFVPDTWFRDDGSGHNALMTIVMSSPTVTVPRINDVNDSGQLVGQSSETNSGLDDRAFLITPADVDGDGNLDWFEDDGNGGNALMIDLEPAPGDTSCSAWAINSVSESGVVQVVGQSWSFNGRVSSGYHGVRWEVDEEGNVTMTDLGQVSPVDINDVGQVVGSYYWGSRNKRHSSALLWENGTMTSLVDMLSNPEGIGDLTARGINEYGDIVGTLSGDYDDGNQHAYIAVALPPAP